MIVIVSLCFSTSFLSRFCIEPESLLFVTDGGARDSTTSDRQPNEYSSQSGDEFAPA